MLVFNLLSQGPLEYNIFSICSTMLVLETRLVGLLAPNISLVDDLFDEIDSDLSSLITLFCFGILDSSTDSLSSLIGSIAFLEEAKLKG